MEKAVFAAGCFWHVEESFQAVKGVVRTEVGFMGGSLKNPSYESVCTDRTGHAEVVYLEFDSRVVSYKDLLKVFWSVHNPTQKNRQGVDEGSQYRSAIFYYTSEQKEIAELSRKEEQKKYRGVIVTEIVPACVFYRAEEYHQSYLMKQGQKACRI